MVMSDTLKALLSKLDPAKGVDFQGLQCALFDSRYTGTITIHLRNGKPQQVDLGAPIRLSIIEAGLTKVE